MVRTRAAHPTATTHATAAAHPAAIAATPAAISTAPSTPAISPATAAHGERDPEIALGEGETEVSEEWDGGHGDDSDYQVSQSRFHGFLLDL
jgi:hypothetical protein